VSKQSWRELIAVQLGVGSTLTAAAEALAVPDFTIPQNYMHAGRILKATLTGIASNPVTTPGTVRLRVRWGGLTGTVLADSGAMSQTTVAQTDKVWLWEVYIVCVTAGTSGQFRTFGKITRGNAAKEATSDMALNPLMLPPSTNALVTVDTTVDKDLSFTHEPSLGTCSWTAQNYLLESVN